MRLTKGRKPTPWTMPKTQIRSVRILSPPGYGKMREINVLAMEIRQSPAEISVTEDDVELVIIGQAAQVVFFPELYIVH